MNAIVDLLSSILSGTVGQLLLIGLSISAFGEFFFNNIYRPIQEALVALFIDLVL